MRKQTAIFFSSDTLLLCATLFVFSGEKLSLKELTEVMKNMDSNMNGTISFDEFVRGMYEFVVKHKTTAERRFVLVEFLLVKF